jgi:hypothetical protein
MPADHECLLSRRRMFLLAGAGIAARLPLGAATAPDFWNKKAPADWTDEEIDRLIAKSPWAKPVKASYAPGEAPDDTNPGGNGTGSGGGYPGGGTGGGGYPGGGTGGGYPGGTGRPRGGIGIPGLGGLNIPGMGRGRKGGGAASPYEGTVRWESARPVLDAMKAPLPEAFEGRYVISVSGIPLLDSHTTVVGEEEDANTTRRHELDDLDRLKGLSSLEARGRDPVQAGMVTRQIGTGSSFLFGFSRELLPLETRDTDIMFTTQMGSLVVKAHFLPKEMQYHGALAV